MSLADCESALVTAVFAKAFDMTVVDKIEKLSRTTCTKNRIALGCLLLLGGSLPVLRGSCVTQHVGKSVRFRRGRAAVMDESSAQRHCPDWDGKAQKKMS